MNVFSNIPCTFIKNKQDIFSIYYYAFYRKKCFPTKESDTKILQSIYFAYKVGIISSSSNRIHYVLSFSEIILFTSNNNLTTVS